LTAIPSGLIYIQVQKHWALTMLNDSYLDAKYLDIKEMQKRTGLFASELLSSLDVFGPYLN